MYVCMHVCKITAKFTHRLIRVFVKKKIIIKKYSARKHDSFHYFGMLFFVILYSCGEVSEGM